MAYPPGAFAWFPSSLLEAKAFAFSESLFFACARALQEQRRTAKLPEGCGTGMCRVKKSNQKKRFTTAEWLVMADQAHSAFAPAALLRVRGAGGIFRRGSSATRPSPGHSPRGECPPAGAKQCFAFFRRAHARRPSGVSRRLRRFGGAPVSQRRKVEAKSRATATATATAAIAVVTAATITTLAAVLLPRRFVEFHRAVAPAPSPYNASSLRVTPLVQPKPSCRGYSPPPPWPDSALYFSTSLWSLA